MHGDALLPTITVDANEARSGLAERLRQHDLFEIVVESLDVGDILIADCILERKTGEDFVRSLRDGRLFRQLLLMRRLYRRRLLIIEGPLHPTQQLPERALLGAQVRISGGLQIPVFPTKDMEGTVRLLERLALQLYCLTPTHLSGARTHRDDGAQFHQVYILAGIPGVGLARARELIRHFGSLQKIFQATEEELRNVPGIGVFLARKISELVRFDAHRGETSTQGGH